MEAAPRGRSGPVKALDTPALLAILEGRREAAWLIEEVAGGEVGTTEVNLCELEAAVRADGRADRARRLAALDRLRRRISVFAVDEKATRAASRLVAEGHGATSLTTGLILGTVQANGATELITTQAGRFEGAHSPVPIRLMRSKPLKRIESRKLQSSNTQ